MGSLRRFLLRLYNVVRPGRAETELARELTAHLSLIEDELQRQGLTPDDARRLARRTFDGIEQTKERHRDARSFSWLDDARRDVQYGVRTLAKNPGFTTVAILTLALGIGANTAIFSLVNAILLKPLGVANSDRIIRLVSTAPDRVSPQASLPLAGVWLQQGGVFHDVSAHRLDLVNLTGTPSPELIPVARVTKDFFRLFGAPLLAGRTFSADEDAPQGRHVAILGYGLWVRQFGARPDIVGQTISLGNESHVIIGVLGAGFDSEQFDQVPDVWVPFQLDPNTRDVGGDFCYVSAGLTPGTSLAQAKAQLAVAANDFRQTHPKDTRLFLRPTVSWSVESERDAIVGNVRAWFAVLEGAVMLVLLIACANVANLLLMRGTRRAPEMAVRAAIGAGRGRLLRQLVTESTVLALAGAVCGLGVGIVGIRALLTTYPSPNPTLLNGYGYYGFGGIPRLAEHPGSVSIDWRVLTFTIAISLVASIVAGLFPALQLLDVDLQHALRRTCGGFGAGARQKTVRSALVVTEIALALVLLVGAGLLIRTSLAFHAVNPGFDTHHVLTMRMSVSGTPFERRDGIARLTRDGLEKIRALPGVTAASTTCCVPLETVWQLDFVVQGRPLKAKFHGFAGWTFVSPGYFDVFSIPIVRGRDFTERDDAGAPGVVIINQEMARRFWPDTDPLNDSLIIGRSVRPDYDADPVRRIIGIVGDVRDQALNLTPRPAMYVPVAQVPDGVTILNVRLLPIVWIARTKTEPYAVGAPIEKDVQAVSHGLPVARIRSMDDVVSEVTARTRFDTVLMSVFAAAALLLAAIGVYGLMAYAVEQRTQEIGIRLALGAGPKQVRRMILRHGMTLALLGIAPGTAASFGLARVLAGMLFGVSPRDPAIFVSVPLLLTGVALFAAWLPAARASRMTPMNALRYE